jgi:hypothetical protein
MAGFRQAGHQQLEHRLAKIEQRLHILAGLLIVSQHRRSRSIVRESNPSRLMARFAVGNSGEGTRSAIAAMARLEESS